MKELISSRVIRSTLSRLIAQQDIKDQELLCLCRSCKQLFTLEGGRAGDIISSEVVAIAIAMTAKSEDLGGLARFLANQLVGYRTILPLNLNYMTTTKKS